jgi:hypothetical protein
MSKCIHSKHSGDASGKEGKLPLNIVFGNNYDLIENPHGTYKN